MNTQAEVTRRSFIGSVAATSATMGATQHPTVADDHSSTPLTFLLLGDTHFDRLEHHDFDWMKQHFAKDIRQVENYCRHTREQLPELLDLAKREFRRSVNPALVVHVGDLVEGICGNRELAERHCDEGWRFLADIGFGAPFLMTKGNHDVTGPGSVEAYRNVLLQRTAGELNRDTLDRTSYSMLVGSSLFAFLDAYDRTGIDWLEQTVDEHDFDRLFVVTHLPVVPYNARTHWRIYDHPNHAERRSRLLKLLGRHNAIVLSGHLHKQSVVVRRTETGRFTQLALSSIIKASGKDNVTRLAGVEHYGPELADLEPNFHPESLERRRALLTAEKSFIERFEYVDQAGFAVVAVEADRVDATFHAVTADDDHSRERVRVA